MRCEAGIAESGAKLARGALADTCVQDCMSAKLFDAGLQYFAVESLRLKDCEVLACMGYLLDSIGATGANLEILWSLGCLINGLKQPFIAGADWNMEPQDLAETGFLELTRSHIDTATNLTHTVTMGGLGQQTTLAAHVHPESDNGPA